MGYGVPVLAFLRCAVFVAFALPLISTPLASAGTADFQTRIIGGSDATSGAWPNIVAILRSSDHQLFCGGTLIAPRVVVTAAHCVPAGTTAASVEVAIGALTLSAITPSQRVVVTTITRHPDYNALSSVNDLALLLLASPSSVAPMPLIDPAVTTLSAGATLAIAGWGNQTPSPIPGGADLLPDTLRENTVLYRANSVCTTAYAGFFDATTMFCASGAGTTPVADTCQGDSGGPITLTISGVRTLVGGTSFGTGCGQSAYPGVYTRLSAVWSWVAQAVTSSTVLSVTNAGAAVTTTWLDVAASLTTWPISGYSVTIGGLPQTLLTTATSATGVVTAAGAIDISVQTNLGASPGGITSWSGTPTPSRAPIVTATVSRNATVGSTLTASGTSDDPWGGPLQYQWSADDVAIAGATASTYLPIAANVGRTISVTVAATNAVGTATASARDEGKTTSKPIANTSNVATKGRPIVGKFLTVRPPAVTAYPVPKITYQWLINGKAITNKTRAFYRIVKADRGRRLSCRMTFENSLGATSVASKPVKVQ